VTAIRPRADTLIVEASSAAFEAPHAVLAAGAWSSEIEVEGQSLPRAFPGQRDPRLQIRPGLGGRRVGVEKGSSSCQWRFSVHKVGRDCGQGSGW
jgi:glycine/D-amino acid oxidase-like deaminating enzyme